ncbi:uncharacterized protein LOC118273739 [Spodoptera frugiperda]|uniref:Uncharacterized protein LOC118273739 n=1 Tax=Spodoptera frugiperda TaxID=7108 RepID=A0A9R0EP57_SPOFR|nr:uncharacterized protein LOC118273739 [Spodoptera frugiperda]
MYFSTVVCCILVTAIKEVLTIITSGLFTIRTEGCTIPGFSKVTERIKMIVAAPPLTRNCTAPEKLVRANTSHIWVAHEAIDSYNVFREDTFYCCYKHFSAPINLNNIVYSECKEFVTVIKVEHEFVQIECYHLDEVIYTDFFLFDFHKEITTNSSHSQESFNVLILGIESMSRLNFHRTMPKTASFLKERGVLEFHGYNKLGDNSLPNLFPLLTGFSYKYVKKICVQNSIFNVDKCALIWDKFKEKGFHTALGSDSIAGLLGNYEYTLPRIPTDSYLQPFIFETRKLFRNQQYNFHPCMGSKYFYKVLLDYIYELAQHLTLHKFFGIFWEESISHEDLNSPHIMDESYVNFLTKLHKDNYLDRTVLIILSDHGMRWGKIVETEQGRLEERLPLLNILFPEQFKQRYKLAFYNIKHNVHRLTTPYDIHETLLDLLNPNSLDDSKIKERSRAPSLNKSSLFVPISAIRNCSSVGIEEHWCACRRGEKIKVGNKMKTMAATNLVVQINKLLKKYSQCHKLILSYIYDVYLVEHNGNWRIYTAMVKTEPGGGIFDGTLIQDTSRWLISGTVSRLNLYRNHSDCVENEDIKLYCYCC